MDHMFKDFQASMKKREVNEIQNLAKRLENLTLEQKQRYMRGYLDSFRFHSCPFGNENEYEPFAGCGRTLQPMEKYSSYLLELLRDIKMGKEAGYLEKELERANIFEGHLKNLDEYRRKNK